MKLSTKIGSVLLSVLMFASSLTVGFAAMAADLRYDDLVNAIKEGQTTVDASYDFYVKDLTNYTVQNLSDGWSDDGNTLAYRHVVTAKDNNAGAITNAARWFYTIVDDLQSTTYDAGCYNTSLITSEMKTQLYSRMTGADHMVRTNSSGDSVYVAPQGVAVNAGMQEPIALNEYSSQQVRSTVYPTNASDKSVFWRVIDGTDYVAVDQNGRVYAKQPTPDGYMATLQCISLDSLDVTAPAVYDENGVVVTPPQISMDNAKYANFYVTVKDVEYSTEELISMLSQFEENVAEKGYTDAQMDALIREYTLKTYPDYGVTRNQILADMASKVPANLEAADAENINKFLASTTRTDADYAAMVKLCYSAVQEEVLKSQNVDIATMDIANLSASGLDPVVITAIREAIADQVKKLYDGCGYTDEYHFFNVDALVNYFMGSSNVVNAANWYHEFEFTVSTDLETAMMDILNSASGEVKIKAVSAAQKIVMQTNTYTWHHTREYDQSGTKARYVLKEGYQHTSSSYTETKAFTELRDVLNVFENFQNSNPTPAGKLNSLDAKAYAESSGLDKIMSALYKRGYSSELLATAFGKMFYWVNSVYNAYRPNYAYDQAKTAGMSYPELYTYRENVRSNPDGSKVPYEMTSDKVNTIVATIDSMLTDTNLGKIISTFFNFNDPKYLGTPVYGQTFETPQQMLKLLVQSMLYTNDIPTMILQKLYPVLTNLIETTVMDAISAYAGLIDGVNDSQDASVTVTIIRALESGGIYLYPYGFARNTPNLQRDYPLVYEVLSQSKFNPTGDYTHAERVGWDQLTEQDWEKLNRGWNVATRTQFENALSTSLYSLLPLLATVLGSSRLEIVAVGIHLRVEPVYGYEFILAPILEALGINKETSDTVLSSSEYNAISADSSQYPKLITSLTTPILNWLENDVLEQPLQHVVDLLVNLSSLLSYSGEDPSKGYNGFLQYALSSTPGIQLGLRVALWYNISIFDGPGLYNMVAGLLPEGADLTSLNGILKSFINFDAPVVKYYNEFGEPVFTHTVYAEDGTVEYTEETMDESLADSVAVSLPDLQDEKLKECGRVIPTYYSQLNTHTYTNCFYRDVQAGQILLYLFRYIFYGIMNTPYSYDGSWTDPTLLDAFYAPWKRTGELFAGLTIDGIINNIVFHPEEALCALLELFAPNETGGMNLTSNVYKLSYPDYQQDVLLATDSKGNQIHKTFGAKVNYTKYWTREYAEDTVSNLEDIVANVLSMLGMGSIEDLLSDLINDNLYTSKILSMLAKAVYVSLQSLQDKIDIQTILDAAFDVRYDVNTLYNTLVYNMCMKYGMTEVSDMPMVLRNMLGVLNRATATNPAGWTEDLFYKEVYLVDEEGNPVMETVFVTDEDGNKIQELDAEGNPAVDADGNPIYKTEEKQKSEMQPLDWGLGEAADGSGTLVGRTNLDGSYTITKEDVFFDALTSLLAPLALIIQRLFLGQNLSILTSPAYPNGLLTVPLYQLYHYALIPLFEALGMPNIVSHNQMVSHVMDRTQITTAGTAFAPNGSKLGTATGDIQLFADIVSPVRGLIHKVMADPISTVLDLIPNLLFYISIGALNDTLNNVLHFAYVLLDILRPIVDVIPIANNLLAGLEIMGIQLNLSLPLEIDFNTLINQLIGSLTEGTLLEGPLQGTGGIEVTDGLYIKIPPIDLSMLCAGLITAYHSASDNTIVKIGTGDGADLITVVLQLAMQVLFMYDNTVNLSLWLADKGLMDGFDTESLYTVMTNLNVMANEDEMPDKVLYIIYLLFKYVAPISGELADRLELMPNGTDEDGNPVYGMTIKEFINALQESGDPLEVIKTILSVKPSDNHQIVSSMSFLERLILFFKRIFAAIQRLFSGAKA